MTGLDRFNPGNMEDAMDPHGPWKPGVHSGDDLIPLLGPSWPDCTGMIEQKGPKWTERSKSTVLYLQKFFNPKVQ